MTLERAESEPRIEPEIESETQADVPSEAVEPTWRRFDVASETVEALTAAQSAIAAGQFAPVTDDLVNLIGKENLTGYEQALRAALA